MDRRRRSCLCRNRLRCCDRRRRRRLRHRTGGRGCCCGRDGRRWGRYVCWRRTDRRRRRFRTGDEKTEKHQDPNVPVSWHLSIFPFPLDLSGHRGFSPQALEMGLHKPFAITQRVSSGRWRMRHRIAIAFASAIIERQTNIVQRQSLWLSLLPSINPNAVGVAGAIGDCRDSQSRR